MIPEIIPLISPTINWTDYLVAAKQTLGRSVTEQLDNHNIPVHSFEGFIASLANVKYEKRHPNDVLIETLKHLSFSFILLIDDDTFHELLEISSLKFVSADSRIKDVKLVIATGTLELWQNETIFWTRRDGDYDRPQRIIFNKILTYFEKIGLGKLFRDYRKQTLDDRTFMLEKK